MLHHIFILPGNFRTPWKYQHLSWSVIVETCLFKAQRVGPPRVVSRQVATAPCHGDRQRPRPLLWPSLPGPGPDGNLNFSGFRRLKFAPIFDWASDTVAIFRWVSQRNWEHCKVTMGFCFFGSGGHCRVLGWGEFQSGDGTEAVRIDYFAPNKSCIR